ncbi:MAG: hypothetical protein PHH44_00025 [bacterium]|nr:hypothetical protein [bacterium]
MIDKTEFQILCIEKCRKLLSKYLKDDIEFVKEGKNEYYYHAKINLTNISIDIYIYEDEAGFAFNKKDWRIFEQPDYKSDNLLITAFLENLEYTVQTILAKKAT